MANPVTDLERLRHAVIVAREGSLSAAATAVPLSQSALTRSIQALEREYGIQIFRRSQAGVDLTVDGALFIARAEHLLLQAEATERELRDISDGNRSIVTFGLGPATAALMMKEILPGLVDLSRTARYRVRSNSSAHLRELLHRGEVDFFVGGLRNEDIENLSGSFSIEPIVRTTRLEAVVRPGHPILSGRATSQRLSAYPIVTPPFVMSLLEGSETERLGPISPSIEVEEFGALIDFTRQSDSVLLTTSAFSPQLKREGLIVLPEPIDQNRKVGYGLMYRSDRPLSRSTRAVADHVVSVVTRLVADEH